jgi:hypothetical protein
MEKKDNVQVGRLIVKICTTCVKLSIVGGHYVKKPIISPTYYCLFKNMKHIYLSHLKLNYSFSFTSHLDTLKRNILMFEKMIRMHLNMVNHVIKLYF